MSDQTPPSPPSAGPDGSSRRAADLGGGSNQARVRAYNERLVLSMIQRDGALSRAEIARRTGLSAQAVNVIARALEDDALLSRGAPVRGKVGQPSIPMALNPDGAFALGFKIGRRSADMILIDLCGKLRGAERVTYAWPEPGKLLEFATGAAERLALGLPAKLRPRIAGLGVATPFALWNWEAEVGAPVGAMAVWRDIDFAAQLSHGTGLAVEVLNDATAACAAEHQLGRGKDFASYAYFFVGFFAGGGVVINNTVYPGPTGNAGALGQLPVDDPAKGYVSLISRGSLSGLENALKAEGRDPSWLWHNPDDWSDVGAPLETWIEATATYLAGGSVAVCAVLDFEAILIDGSFPAAVRTALTDRTRAKFEGMAAPGLSPVQFVAGTLGSDARAVGAAMQPIAGRFLMNQNVLLKTAG